MSYPTRSAEFPLNRRNDSDFERCADLLIYALHKQIGIISAQLDLKDNILSATANAALKGVLLKGGIQLENAAKIRVVAFDKTGTLTTGRPAVADVVPFARRNAGEVLSRAASVEARSEHPLAQGRVAEAQARGLTLEAIDDFRTQPGLGVSAELGGKRVHVGSVRFMQPKGIDLPAEHQERLVALENQGTTILLVHEANGAECWLSLNDLAMTRATWLWRSAPPALSISICSRASLSGSQRQSPRKSALMTAMPGFYRTTKSRL